MNQYEKAEIVARCVAHLAWQAWLPVREVAACIGPERMAELMDFAPCREFMSIDEMAWEINRGCWLGYELDKDAPLPPEDFGEKTVQRMEDDGLDLYTALVKA